MKIILKILLIVTTSALIFNLTAALAQNGANGNGNVNQPPPSSSDITTLDNPLGDIKNPTQLYGRLIFAFMGMAGVVALLMFVIGGFQWMTAGGNAEKVKKGRDTLLWAVIGLILIFSSYAILRAIFETLRF